MADGRALYEQRFPISDAGTRPASRNGAGRTRLRVFAIYNVQRRIIELFDPVTRVQIGTVGPAGFRPPENQFA